MTRPIQYTNNTQGAYSHISSNWSRVIKSPLEKGEVKIQPQPCCLKHIQCVQNQSFSNVSLGLLKQFAFTNKKNENN